MVTSNSRGHKTYYDGEHWRFSDNDQIDDGQRACKRCGHMPTDDGNDACLGHVDGVKSACCGHGIVKPYEVKG